MRPEPGDQERALWTVSGLPGVPECDFTKPLVIEMPGSCPRCGSRILKRTSKKGYTYYACEKGAECGFMTWDVPGKGPVPGLRQEHVQAVR